MFDQVGSSLPAGADHELDLGLVLGDDPARCVAARLLVKDVTVAMFNGVLRALGSRREFGRLPASPLVAKASPMGAKERPIGCWRKVSAMFAWQPAHAVSPRYLTSGPGVLVRRETDPADERSLSWGCATKRQPSRNSPPTERRREA